MTAVSIRFRPGAGRLLKSLRQPGVILTAAILLLALAARLAPGLRTIDDAFITFRYARNILAGNGFVYNPGEQVLGTTTPLFTILIAGLASLTGGTQANFPALALAVSALADGLTCLLLVDTGRRLGYPAAGYAAGLAWAIAPFSVTFAIGGLETSLYVCLLTAAMHAHLAGWGMRTAAFAGLSLLTRPDALIWIGPLAVERLRQTWMTRRAARPAPLWGEAAAFLISTLPWLIFATAYFGSPLPHSITAKAVAYQLSPEAAFVRLLQHYATPFLEHLTLGNVWIGIGLVVYPFLTLVAARNVLKRCPTFWPCLAYPWLYLAVFSLANPLIFRWYLTPPLPIYTLTILIGLNALLQPLVERQQSGRAAPAARLLWLILLIPALLSLRDWTLHPDHGPDRPAPQMAWHQLELLYRQAAEVVAARIPPGGPPPVLAAGDVGVLGFYTPAAILDTVGLNSPTAAGYYPLDERYYVINYAVPPDLVFDARPEYLVFLEVYIRQGLLNDPRFAQEYTLLEKIPTAIYGSDGMLIFRRLDTP